MKFLTSEIMAIVQEREVRRNLRAMVKYLVVLAVVVAVYTVIFHVLMLYEGQQHSWLTGLYWTLTVMSTLGFGDITFHTDLGRLFSMVVLLSGILLLLIVLPFAFIRYLYAPWLEAQLRFKAPRSLPEDTEGHVILCALDPLAEVLIEHLDLQGVPYVVVDPDAAHAVERFGDGYNMLVGPLDSTDTWRAARVEKASLVVANLADTNNTNVTITVREVAPDVPIVALVDDKDAVDILELSGATDVVPVKHRLGEQLAGRVSVGQVGVHEVGRIDDLQIAEFPLHNTKLVGRKIKDTRIRELTGLSIVGYWERGKLLPAHPEAMLSDYSVAVVAGSNEQVDELRAMLSIYETREKAVVVIGGGKVGRAVIRALKARNVTVHVIEEDASLRPLLEKIADHVVIGDAADIEAMQAVEIESAPSVVLSTHDDSINIYLAVYARRLNPDAYIVSRMQHGRNLEALHRAGANSVLGVSSLGAATVLSVLQKRELCFIGEEIEVFILSVPPGLEGRTLADAGIGAKTGMNVIGLRVDGASTQTVAADTALNSGAEMIVLGTKEQRQEFAKLYEGPVRG